MILSNKQLTKALIRLYRLVCAFVVCKLPKTGFLALMPICTITSLYLYEIAIKNDTKTCIIEPCLNMKTFGFSRKQNTNLASAILQNVQREPLLGDSKEVRLIYSICMNIYIKYVIETLTHCCVYQIKQIYNHTFSVLICMVWLCIGFCWQILKSTKSCVSLSVPYSISQYDQKKKIL